MTDTSYPGSDFQNYPRPLPATDQDTQPYWTGGKNNELLIYRCKDCCYYVHPPLGFCPKCEGRNVKPEPVSGKGVITSFTVNHKQWLPNLPVPYVVALVSIEEQEDVRLVSNIINCDINNVHIGMNVRVFFEQHEDLWIPLFEPEKSHV